MNTASLNLCKKLYELSGWNEPSEGWYKDNNEEWIGVRALYDHKPGGDINVDTRSNFISPAYDLGYLLRKLPLGTELTKGTKGYFIAPPYQYRKRSMAEYFDTPEDAACKLAIELFKQGVLKK